MRYILNEQYRLHRRLQQHGAAGRGSFFGVDPDVCEFFMYCKHHNSTCSSYTYCKEITVHKG